MVERRGPALRLTMLDLVKIVVACSVAAACITPSFRVMEAGFADPWTVAIIDAIIVPLVFVLFCYLMVQPGPRRDAMVAWLILFAVLIAMLAIISLFGPSSPIIKRMVRYGRWVVLMGELPQLALVIAGFLLLMTIALGLVWRLIRLRRTKPDASPRTSDRDEVKSSVGSR